MKSKTYEEFVEKFKPKKTTDDCFTPPEIYEVVKDYACGRYNIDPKRIVRPFWPGGNYEPYDYPDECVVIDNPPFSILSKICEFYLERGIPFFLFSPSLTIFSARKVLARMNHIICAADIVYENGAVVKTSFVTNLDKDILAESAPELTRRINDVINELKKATKPQLPKYDYPAQIVTAAMIQRYAGYGVHFQVRSEDCTFIAALDAQKEKGKTIFGGGLLLSEKAAAEKAAAEKVSRIVWELSEREKDIVANLG